MTEPRRGPAGPTSSGRGHVPTASIPAHVGIVLGLATAGYAVTLAGVSSLQASADAAVAAARAPAGAAIEEATRRHDRLDAAIGEAGRAYEEAAARYGADAGRVSELDGRLADLATVTHAIDGATRALPTRIAMPPVVRTIARSSGGGAHATSGGSAAP